MKRERSEGGGRRTEGSESSVISDQTSEPCAPGVGAASGGSGAVTWMGETFLTRREMARVLRVSLRTLDAMVGREEIPCVRLRGRLVRFCVEDVVRKLKGE